MGDGPLRAELQAEAARRGVGDRVIFAGARGDVPMLLQAFDVFALPSLREGLPLVGLEAQAAGRPLVLADHITRELVVVPELFSWVPVEAPAAAWGEALLHAAERPPAAGDPVAALERSEFALARSLPGLLHAWAAAA
ncbi:MAG: glycosyltransferase [Anaeromyxobacter sp.]